MPNILPLLRIPLTLSPIYRPTPPLCTVSISVSFPLDGPDLSPPICTAPSSTCLPPLRCLLECRSIKPHPTPGPALRDSDNATPVLSRTLLPLPRNSRTHPAHRISQPGPAVGVPALTQFAHITLFPEHTARCSRSALSRVKQRHATPTIAPSLHIAVRRRCIP